MLMWLLHEGRGFGELSGLLIEGIERVVIPHSVQHATDAEHVQEKDATDEDENQTPELLRCVVLETLHDSAS